MQTLRVNRCLLLIATCCLLVATGANAQVGSALIAVPWQPEQRFSATNYFIGLQTESESFGGDTNLARGVSFGRLRLDPNDPRGLTFGWLYDHTEIDSGDPLLPERLNSTAVAVGMNLGEVIEGWDVSVSGGFGNASTLPYTDEDGYYGLGSIVATKRLDQRTALTLLLDFDGSRAVLPDVPLPGLQYSVFVSPKLRYSLGLPFSTIYYQPDDRWTFDITYLLPLGGRAEVKYAIDDRWTVFTRYNATNRAYHIDGAENDRIFFEQDRVSAGVDWTPADGWKWSFSAGWAFDQEFTTGFDTFDDEGLRSLDDAAFLRIGLRLDF
ncbi:MAG: hypothetical protein AAF333_11055 [Planctomycetota bacterium]